MFTAFKDPDGTPPSGISQDCSRCQGQQCCCGGRCRPCREHAQGLHRSPATSFLARVEAHQRNFRFRRRVEAKYQIVERIKRLAQLVAKKALVTLVGLGIFAGSAAGMTFDKKTADTFNREMKGTGVVDGQEVVKVHADYKEMGGQHEIDFTYESSDGSRVIVKCWETSNHNVKDVKVFQKKNKDGYVDPVLVESAMSELPLTFVQWVK